MDVIMNQAAAAELCQFTRSAYRHYSIRTQATSHTGTPVDLFAQAVGRQYGPTGGWSPRLAHQLSVHAHLYLSMSEQHLAGLQVLIEGGVSGIAVGPLARSVAEASGRVAWLLDNRLSLERVDARRRVARLLLDTDENAKIYKRLAKNFDLPDRARAGDTAKRTADAVRRPGMFYPSEIKIDSKTGNVALCTEVLPGPSGFVRLAGDVFGDSPQETSGHYGYMSAMTHPTVFAFVETLADMHTLPPDMSEIPYRRDEEFVAKLAGNAVRDFYNAWRIWIAWTETGTQEADLVHAAHGRSIGQ